MQISTYVEKILANSAYRVCQACKIYDLKGAESRARFNAVACYCQPG